MCATRLRWAELAPPPMVLLRCWWLLAVAWGSSYGASARRLALLRASSPEGARRSSKRLPARLQASTPGLLSTTAEQLYGDWAAAQKRRGLSQTPTATLLNDMAAARREQRARFWKTAGDKGAISSIGGERSINKLSPSTSVESRRFYAVTKCEGPAHGYVAP